jgi:aminoacyl tRNA synthase complex-interacting multifunctional protein 1
LLFHVQLVAATPEAELKDKMVLTILNLKVAKLAGQVSEAMILATEAEVNGEMSVKLVNVPAGAAIGDKVNAEGIAPAETFPKVGGCTSCIQF